MLLFGLLVCLVVCLTCFWGLLWVCNLWCVCLGALCVGLADVFVTVVCCWCGFGGVAVVLTSFVGCCGFWLLLVGLYVD